MFEIPADIPRERPDFAYGDGPVEDSANDPHLSFTPECDPIAGEGFTSLEEPLCMQSLDAQDNEMSAYGYDSDGADAQDYETTTLTEITTTTLEEPTTAHLNDIEGLVAARGHDQSPIGMLMDELDIPIMLTETDKEAYLEALTGDKLLDGIARISAFARGVPVEQNTPEPKEHIIIYEGGQSDNNFDDSASILRVPLYHGLAREVLREVPDVARSIGDPDISASFVRLMIALGHVQLDGNGAASRFYEAVIRDGYAGNADDSKYLGLLHNSDMHADDHPEASWAGSFALHYADRLTEHYSLPFPIKGYTDSTMTKQEFKRLPIERSCPGIAIPFIESGAAGVFATEIIARSGRSIRAFTTKIVGQRYTKTDKLLRSMRPEETGLVTDVCNYQKMSLLRAVMQKFATGQHPAFEGYDIHTPVYGSKRSSTK